MEEIYEIIIRKNFKYVESIINRNGDTENLSDSTIVDIDHVISGISELNKNGIVISKICTGLSHDGITKIKNIESFGLYKNNTWIKKPTDEDYSIPENEFIPFKSDSWILGEFIIRHKTGKNIPKKFLKSQNLLNTFIGDDEILKNLLVINPENRSYVWEIVKEENQGCVIQ